jgi:hypothetical protein
VLIPYERPATQDQPSTQDWPATPIFIAPSPEPDGYADPNNLTESIRARIRQLAQELPSQAAIERTVFGYNGGAAYRAVKDILDKSN